MSLNSDKIPALPVPSPDAPWPTFSISRDARRAIGEGNLPYVHLGPIEQISPTTSALGTSTLASPTDKRSMGSGSPTGGSNSSGKPKRSHPRMPTQPVSNPATTIGTLAGAPFARPAPRRTHVPLAGSSSNLPYFPPTGGATASSPLLATHSTPRQEQARRYGTLSVWAAVVSAALLLFAYTVFRPEAWLFIMLEIVALFFAFTFGGNAIKRSLVGDTARAWARIGLIVATIIIFLHVIMIFLHF